MQGRAKHLSLLFTITGFVLAMISEIFPYKSIFQLVALGLIVVGVQLLVRYVLTDFRYIIDDKDDGTADLIIFKRQGKREAKVCHVGMANVTDIFKKGEKKLPSDNRFNYCRNLTDEAWVILMRDGEKTTELYIEPDAAFLGALRERAGIGESGMGFVMN
jgi:hypothetical protein